PVSDVCDGEGAVITHVLTARLFSVTVKIFLLVAPGRLGRGAQNQDPEDEQDGQPHL
ncbi:hypothetical protein NQD34_011495, partial [Periophthalmus magnuspinnatus]